ncbi:hypothetical protein GW17_00057272 [Ensete ventricosum]|nr:hypothetical protein GW17_00057272 [Ensete ventricosum]
MVPAAGAPNWWARPSTVMWVPDWCGKCLSFQRGRGRRTDLNRSAGVERGGLGEDAVADAGAAVVVDAELDPRHPPVPGRDVRPDARQRLRYQSRYAAVEHLERLPPLPNPITNPKSSTTAVGDSGART